jgi:hypothetical protein
MRSPHASAVTNWCWLAFFADHDDIAVLQDHLAPLTQGQVDGIPLTASIGIASHYTGGRKAQPGDSSGAVSGNQSWCKKTDSLVDY